MDFLKGWKVNGKFIKGWDEWLRCVQVFIYAWGCFSDSPLRTQWVLKNVSQMVKIIKGELFL
jgi:hypothetical protein